MLKVCSSIKKYKKMMIVIVIMKIWIQMKMKRINKKMFMKKWKTSKLRRSLLKIILKKCKNNPISNQSRNFPPIYIINI